MKKAKNYDLKREQISKDPDLGKITDVEMGERYGVSKTFVCKIRNRLGVDFEWKRNSGRPKSPRRDKVIKHKSLLGVYSDYSISRHLEVNKETVRRVRLEMGLSPGKKNLDDTVVISDEQSLLDSWKCIPERVGLTKNQWLNR